MAYDFFTAVPEPTIPISLYSDAAKGGTAVGNAIPTTTTAIIQGAIQGFSQGQEIASNQQKLEAQSQENEIRQNQIEQLPITNELQIAQLQNAQSVERINKMKLDMQLKNQAINQELEEKKVQAEKAKFDDEVKTYETKKKIEDTLRSENPRAVLDDPDMSAMVFSDSKYANGVLAALDGRGVIRPEERDDLLGRVDYIRAQELRIQEQAARLKSKQKIIDDLDKISQAVEDSHTVTTTLASAGIDNPQDLWNSDAQVVPSNVKTYKKDKDGNTTNEVDTSAPDKYSGPDSGKPTSYDLIINGKRAPQAITDAKDAALLTKYINAGKTAFGRDNASADSKKAEVPAPLAAPQPVPIKNREQINSTLSQAGIPVDRAAPILEEAIKRGQTMTLAQRITSNIIPDALEGDPILDSVIAQFDEPASSQQTRELVAETAPKLADATMEQLKTADADKKEALRDWAAHNNVKLTKSGLTDYYSKSIRKTLSQAYKDSLNIGYEEKAQLARNDVAKQAAEELKYGRSPKEILAAKKPVEAAPKEKSAVPDFYYDPTSAPEYDVIEHLDEKVDELVTRYGLSNKVASTMRTTAMRIEDNEYFKNQPAHVKAVAAVESAGNPGAVSSTGVRGLMQVTQRVAASYGLNRNIPSENVQAGAMYLDDLIAEFKGVKELAYAAYNAGPAVVHYAQRLAGGSSNWADLKPHLLAALTKYRNAIGVRPAQKLQELYNYPERVAINEELFKGSIPAGGDVA